MTSLSLLAGRTVQPPIMILSNLNLLFVSDCPVLNLAQKTESWPEGYKMVHAQPSKTISTAKKMLKSINVSYL